MPTRQEPTMQVRNCTRCGRPFTLADLSREETGNLETERKANGLEGIKFLYFRCPACGMAAIEVLMKYLGVIDRVQPQPGMDAESVKERLRQYGVDVDGLCTARIVGAQPILST
jgi:hypothetical protein